jgi:hypothetical protein
MCVLGTAAMAHVMAHAPAVCSYSTVFVELSVRTRINAERSKDEE